jgi:response regulator RpfG family c-di-GMP phosphodiesterase
MTSVLVVDDEPAGRNVMARWIASLGLQPDMATTADEALVTLSNDHYDLAVIDVVEPGRDGLWLARELQRAHPHTAVVVATAYAELLARDAERRPAVDLLPKPFKRERLALAVDRGREWRRQALEELRSHALLSLELTERTHEICAEIARCADAAAEADLLIRLMGDRSRDLIEHGDKVARHAHRIAREMDAGLDDTMVDLAARLHDVGRAAMPDALLTKHAPLTPTEAAIMRRHVNAGGQILSSSRSLAPLAPIVLASHEWFDGGGYPNRLSGHQIPLASRIIAVADAYVSSARDPQTGGAAGTSHLLQSKPLQFDPHVVAALTSVLARG